MTKAYGCGRTGGESHWPPPEGWGPVARFSSSPLLGRLLLAVGLLRGLLAVALLGRLLAVRSLLAVGLLGGLAAGTGVLGGSGRAVRHDHHGVHDLVGPGLLLDLPQRREVPHAAGQAVDEVAELPHEGV